MSNRQIGDIYRIYERLKALLLALIAMSILITPVYAIIIFSAVCFFKQKVEKKKMALMILSCAILSFIWLLLSDINLQDILKELVHYPEYIFLIAPERLLLVFITALLYEFKGELLFTNITDWNIEQERKRQEIRLKRGKFNFDSTSHMLLTGTTGAGKTLMLNHIVKHAFSKGLFTVIVSGKLAGADNHSMLAYCEKMAQKYGRTLYVVSMNSKVMGCSYNPFKYCDWDEIKNILSYMLPFSEDYYRSNFIMWMSDIYNAIEAGGDTFSIPNAIKLYSLKNYQTYVKGLLDSKKIEQETYNNLVNDLSANHARIAEDSASRLEELYKNRPYLTKGNKISITEAREKNAIIFFDLNGNSAADASRALGAMITGELQHIVSNESIDSVEDRKILIFDELSYYCTELFLPLYNLSRSAGYQCYAATQSFSDLNKISEDFCAQMIENSNQFGFMRQNESKDAEIAANTCGTVLESEITHKLDGIEYEPTGSQKVVDVYIANPNFIKNLKVGEMVYLEKNSESHDSHVSLVKWTPDDL